MPQPRGAQGVDLPHVLLPEPRAWGCCPPRAEGGVSHAPTRAGRGLAPLTNVVLATPGGVAVRPSRFRIKQEGEDRSSDLGWL